MEAFGADDPLGTLQITLLTRVEAISSLEEAKALLGFDDDSIGSRPDGCGVILTSISAMRGFAKRDQLTICAMNFE